MAFEPNYVDRHMSSSAEFGDTGELVENSEKVVLQPNSGALKGVLIFGCIFLVVSSIVVWRFTGGPGKWLTVAFGLIAGPIMFGSIYWIIKQNVDKGPYIAFNRINKKITIPRLGVEFDHSEIELLQLITGRSKRLPDVQTDLNLVVREENGLGRYLIMPSSNQKYANKFAKLCDLDIVEINLAPNRFRDTSLDDSPRSK